MLGACNTCVRLQTRVESFGATIHGLVFIFIFIIFLFLFFLVVVCFLFCFFTFYFFSVIVLLLVLFCFIYLLNFLRDRVGTEDWVFHGGWGMGLEALIRRNTVIWGDPSWNVS